MRCLFASDDVKASLGSAVARHHFSTDSQGVPRMQARDTHRANGFVEFVAIFADPNEIESLARTSRYISNFLVERDNCGIGLCRLTRSRIKAAIN